MWSDPVIFSLPNLVFNILVICILYTRALPEKYVGGGKNFGREKANYSLVRGKLQFWRGEGQFSVLKGGGKNLPSPL